MRMTGNTILVTGGTSGIGLALAEAFLARGNTVIVTGRRQPAIDEIAAQRPGLTALPLDLDDPRSLPALRDEVLDRFPTLDAVCVNAGISGREDLAAEWDLTVTERLIDTNVTGALRTIATFLPHLRRRPSATLMVTGSKLAFLPSTAFPTYCATKAFLHSWLQSLRHQLRGTGVEVLELLPPYVATKLTGEDQLADPRAMPLGAFTEEVMALLAAGDHPHGEVLVERARSDRYAEREGRYDAAFDAVNPR